jgi:hypothetical protein
MVSFATGRGLSEKEASSQFDQFTHSAESKGRTYVNWEAAWRTWVLKSIEWKPKSNGVAPKKFDEMTDEEIRADRRSRMRY